MTKAIKHHKQFSDADYVYLSKKGYSNKEILSIWNRDEADRKPAIKSFSPIFDVVGYLNK